MKGYGFMTSYAVVRTGKLHRGDVTGIQRHNQRQLSDENIKASASRIDSSLSHLNYDLINDGDINYLNKIDEFVDKHVEKKIRKDAVLVNDWIITSDKAFFDNLSEDETKRYFEESLKYFAKEFGEEKMLYATVHMDEKTPHMHLGIMPYVEETKSFSAKKVVHKKRLVEIQDEYPLHMASLGFDIKRGKPNSKEEHKSVLEMRETSVEGREDALNGMSENLKRELREREEKEKQLSEKEKAVQTELRDLKVKQRSLKKLHSGVMEKQQELDTREQGIDETEASLKQTKETLERRERDVQARQVAVSEREKDVDDKEQKLAKRERYVNNSQAVLDTREQAIADRERELEVKAKEMDEEYKRKLKNVDSYSEQVETKEWYVKNELEFLGKHLGYGRDASVSELTNGVGDRREKFLATMDMQKEWVANERKKATSGVKKTKRKSSAADVELGR